MATPVHTVSKRICQEGHANALALNKECTQIAVAGRSLLKVYSIETDGFLEVCNMRGGKNQNLSYSSNDVAWSTLDNHLLATAATNGVVSVWDLSKFGRQKQLYVYNEHERTAHSVTFHSAESNLLISGSQDGTIKCFDMRTDKAIHTFCSNSEAVRDVKFSPQYPNLFAAVSENGTVQLWDLKRPDKCQLQFTAHSGPVYTCDWHPTQPWLATGSRDRQIKVWKMEAKPVLEYTIHTIAVVGRVKWRPERQHHIASCSLVVDYSIYIWDVRRPFIPYASFNEHTNVTTGIAFKGNDPHVLMSASKDSTIFKHSFKDAVHPNSTANPQATSFNSHGDLLFSYKVKNPPTPIPTVSRSTGFISDITNSVYSTPRSTPPSSADQFHLAKSCLMTYSARPPKPTPHPQPHHQSDGDRNSLSSTTFNKDTISTTANQHKDVLSFKGCAREYILTGGSLSEICDYNAEIARKYGKPNVTMLWRFVRNQYADGKISGSSLETRNSTSSQNILPSRLLLCQQQSQFGTSTASDWDADGQRDQSYDTSTEEALAKMCCENLKLQDFRHPKSGEFKHSGGGQSAVTSGLLQQQLTGDLESVNNFMYGEAELTVDDMDCVKGLRNGFLYIGPHDLTKSWSLPHNNLNELQSTKTAQAMAEESRQQQQQQQASESGELHPEIPNQLRLGVAPPCVRWEPHSVLTEGLILQTDVGDVQTPVCILIAMGERRNELAIDELIYESWLLSYIELLHRQQMWSEATEIINMSWIYSVRELNQQSTTMHTNCGECGKPMSNAGWYCGKCKSAQSSDCSICNQPVRGLYAWCQGCAHGGHLQHMQQWFENHSKCPKCGHMCEYE